MGKHYGINRPKSTKIVHPLFYPHFCATTQNPDKYGVPTIFVVIRMGLENGL